MSQNVRTEENELRVKTFEPYLNGPKFTLTTWDTNQVDALGKSVIEYSFEQDGVEIFTNRLHVGLSTAIDSDESLRSCMAFICLRPGDTDAEYFDEYDDAQTTFANEHAEVLGCAMDEEEEVA